MSSYDKHDTLCIPTKLINVMNPRGRVFRARDSKVKRKYKLCRHRGITRKYIGSLKKTHIALALGIARMILIDLLFITGGSVPTQNRDCDDAAEPNMIFFKDPHIFSYEAFKCLCNGSIPRWFNQYINYKTRNTLTQARRNLKYIMHYLLLLHSFHVPFPISFKCTRSLA